MGPTNPGAAAQSAAAALWLASILTDVVPQAPIMPKKHSSSGGLDTQFLFSMMIICPHYMRNTWSCEPTEVGRGWVCLVAFLGGLGMTH